MNEQGLAIGMMTVSAAHGPDDPQKQTVSSLLIIRLILDYAKNVEEAIAIFGTSTSIFREGLPCTISLQTGQGSRLWLNL